MKALIPTFIWLYASLATFAMVAATGGAAQGQQLLPLKQQAYRDSLIAKSSNYASDRTDAANAAFKLADYYRVTDTAQALKYLRQGEKALGTNPGPLAVAALNFYTGMYYKERQKQRAAGYFGKCTDALAGLNTPAAYELKAQALLNKAICEKDRAGYDKLVRTIVEQCIPLLQQAKNTVALANMYAQLGIIMTYNAAFADAGKYIARAIAMLEKAAPQSNDLFIAYMYMTANLCYQSKGTAAAVFLEKGHKIIEPYPAQVNQSFYYYNKMLVAISQQRNSEALSAAATGAALAAKGNQLMLLQMFCFNEYDILKKLGKPAEARQKLLDILADHRLVADIRNRKTVYGEMAKLFEDGGDYRQALQWQKKCSATADTMHRQALDLQISELSARFNATERERDLKLARAELANEKQIKLIAVMGAGLTLVAAALLGMVFYNRQRFARERARQLAKDLVYAKEREALRVASALLEGEEAERLRLARDLHDGVGATLAAAGMAVYAATEANAGNDSLPGLGKLIETAKQELRHVAHNIMPAAITDGNFKGALKQLCVFYNANGLHTDFTYDGEGTPLNVFEQSHLYRVVQELFTNIIKHAQATRAILSFKQDKRGIELTLKDNGKGMATAITNNGNGLANIRQRIACIKGELLVESGDGQGTTFTIKLTTVATD